MEYPFILEQPLDRGPEGKSSHQSAKKSKKVVMAIPRQLRQRSTENLNLQRRQLWQKQ
jgi:hypothetical protein